MSKKKQPKKSKKLSFEAGSLVQVADPITGEHGTRVVKREEGDDLILATLDRPDIESRVAKEFCTLYNPA